VLVIGAGLAGLAAAWRLSRAGSRVSVLECEARAGGRLAGDRVDGYTIEPVHALIGAGDVALRTWIAELGLRDEMLPAKPMTTGFAGRDGLRDVDLRTLRDVARIPGMRRLHAGRLVRLPRLLARYGSALELGAAEEAEQYDDRSLTDFARLYFGRSVLERWMAPMACAGSLGDPAEMSRVQFLQHFWAHRLNRPGVLRGPLEDLIERAAAAVDVVTQCRVERIEPGSDGGFRALAAGGRSFVGDAVVVATPAPLAAELADPLLTTPERSFLGAVRYTPAFCVSAALCRQMVPRARRILLSPEASSPLGSAVVEPGFRGSRVPAGCGLATLEATGGFAAAHPETPDESLEKELIAELDRLWPGFASSVEFTRVFRHRYGSPRFDVGAYRALARFRRVQADRRSVGRRLAFAGDYLVHPSPEGALRSGERAAAELLSEEGA
jgi:oxygen-dependent protoporphyrinogen oxidase